MANGYDASNPYVREAVAAGVGEPWIASFLRGNPNDYHRILTAAGVGSSALTLPALAPTYQVQVRPETAGVSTLGASLFGGGSPLLLVAVAAAAWFIYKKL
jgi:hypothetical protein